MKLNEYPKQKSLLALTSKEPTSASSKEFVSSEGEKNGLQFHGRPLGGDVEET